MKKRKILKKAIFAVLLVTVIITVSATAVFAAQGNDYSKPGSLFKAEFDSSDLLSDICGEELFQAEREYLEIYGELKLFHAASIPASLVSVGENNPGGEFLVKAVPYLYTAENGVLVSFIPEIAVIGEAEFNFTENAGGEYLISIDSSYYDENGSIRVVYSTEVEISKEDANALLDNAYNDAREWKEILQDKKEEYESALAKYRIDSAAYGEYVTKLAEYEAKRAEYEDYLIRKASYDRRLDEYNRYRAELAVYEEEKAAYEDYLMALGKYNDDILAYREYVYIKENYDALYDKYEKYLKDLETAKYQLSIIDGLKNTSTELKRSIYSAVVIGTTVSMVIENKDAIANRVVGTDAALVDLAEVSTKNIRALCNAYFSLENEAEKYAYYILNYERFRSNFTSLFISLDKMYENSKVKIAIKEEGLQEKYEILIAQLYYVVNALNDSPVYNYDKKAVYDSKYVVNSLTKAKPITLLENVPYMTDRDCASPLSTGYPSEVKKPVINEVAEPNLPSFVAEPALPYPVENPGQAPEEIENPESEKPEKVNDPGDEPVEYLAPPKVEALVAAYDRGEIKVREQLSAPIKIKHRIEVIKSLGDAEFVTVSFMDAEGNPICPPLLVEKWDYPEFNGEKPTKPSNAEADYEFLWWVNSSGERYTFGPATENLVLYPYFEKQIKSYSIVWKIDENHRFEEILPYGAIPKAPDSLINSYGDAYKYVFEGWADENGNAIKKVEGDAEYTALKTPVFKAESGNAVTVKKDESGYSIECTNSPESSFNLANLFTRVTPNEYISIKSRDVSLTLTPEAIVKMKTRGVSTVEVKTKIVRAGYEILLNLLDGDGNYLHDARAVSEDIRITLTKCYLPFDNYEAVSLYYLEDGKRRLVRATYENGEFKATLIAGKTYYAIEEYSINVISSGDLVISCASVARSGETVKVQLSSLPSGAVLDRLYYVDSEGNRVTVENGKFIMPSFNVLVGAEYHIPVYKVTFVADGKVILSAEYKLGEKVAVPPVPGKAPDLKFYYTHGFWSPDITEVRGNAIYEAKYIPNEIIPEPEKDGLQISPSVMHVLAKVFIIGFYGVVIITLLPVIIIKAVRRSHRKAR